MWFERLRLNWQIRKLQNQRDKNITALIGALREVIEETGEVPDKDVVSEALVENVEVNRQIDEHIAILETMYWMGQAERYLIPTPKDEAHVKPKYGAKIPYYNDKALAELRSAVRKEQKERSENFRTWTTLLIGLAGTLIGLIAMLKT